jgi:uncharacterized membrane protein YhaH (DUF805 family)
MFKIFAYEFKNSFNVTGRACRKEVWIFNLMIGFICVALYLLGKYLNLKGQPGGAVCIFLAYAFNAINIPALICLSIRRLHDINMSGWILLVITILLIIPLINILVWFIWFIMSCFIKGSDEINKYGEVSELYYT